MMQFDGKPFTLLWKRPIQYLAEPALRGAGFNAVARVTAAAWPEFGNGEDIYVKKQAQYYCRPSWNLFRATPTLRREVLFLQRARQAGVRTPRILGYGDIADGRVMLLFAAIPAAEALDMRIAAHPAARATIIGNVAALLISLHRAGISHGAMSPAHLLVGPAPAFDVTLIEYENSRELPSTLAARSDLSSLLRRAPFLTQDDRRIIGAAYGSAGFAGMRLLLPRALRG